MAIAFQSDYGLVVYALGFFDTGITMRITQLNLQASYPIARSPFRYFEDNYS